MAKSWQEIDRALKGQRAGLRILMQRGGIAMVKYRYIGEYISAELLDAAGKPCATPGQKYADNLRHIAVSQLDANPGGAELWQRSAGTLEWILDGDVTISRRNYPGSDHDLVIGQDLRELAACPSPEEDQPEAEAERPRMYA
ncbi:hypothetical protein LJR290_007459 [Variovorax sp. LjRoot290]|uniref:hypothetical protein n=1 Tax=Variovorax sp. LjRoot290 TaxID=3342316 RepID=UPI003ECD20DE